MFAFEDPAATGLNLLLQQAVVTKRHPPNWRVLEYLECILTAFKALEPTKAISFCVGQGGKKKKSLKSDNAIEVLPVSILYTEKVVEIYFSFSCATFQK